ncbi:glutathione S-transferase omega-1-like [Discoglossus pictus]
MPVSEKSLGKGSPAPGPVPKGSIRLYSMRFCPFSQRARLVLAAKGIKHEVVNIKLKNKPEWYWAKNPFGQIPSLETAQGQIIYDSTIVCHYLDEVYAGKKLNPKDPFQKAQQRMTLEHYSTIVGLLYKILDAKGKKEDTTGLKAEFQKKFIIFDETLGKLKTCFFGGDSVSMVDYLIWPWFERFHIFEVTESLNKAPHIYKWYQLMLKDPAVKATFIKPDVFQEFYKLSAENDPDVDDYGL